MTAAPPSDVDLHHALDDTGRKVIRSPAAVSDDGVTHLPVVTSYRSVVWAR
jgi:hypothetical protein